MGSGRIEDIGEWFLQVAVIALPAMRPSPRRLIKEWEEEDEWEKVMPFPSHLPFASTLPFSSIAIPLPIRVNPHPLRPITFLPEAAQHPTSDRSDREYSPQQRQPHATRLLAHQHMHEIARYSPYTAQTLNVKREEPYVIPVSASSSAQPGPLTDQRSGVSKWAASEA